MIKLLNLFFIKFSIFCFCSCNFHKIISTTNAMYNFLFKYQLFLFFCLQFAFSIFCFCSCNFYKIISTANAIYYFLFKYQLFLFFTCQAKTFLSKNIYKITKFSDNDQEISFWSLEVLI